MKNNYNAVLSLDCICGYFLTVYERCLLIKLKKDYKNAPEPTARIIKMLELIEHYKWKPPEYNVDHSKLVNYYDEKGNERPIETYNHPIINEVNKLK